MKILQNTKFGINFYDPIDYEGSDVQYSSDQISKSVALANENFDLIRTISDFNAGDPGQFVGSAYQPIPGTAINTRNAAWQEAVRSTTLDVILTIEHPKKWLATLDLAVSYIYQYVLPLLQNFNMPKDAKYQPDYYGTTPVNPEIQFFNVKDHVKAIVVGLEVGTHLQTSMPQSQFASKADIVTNLPLYVDNLLKALDIFGLRNVIKVTSSFAPSNANKSAEELANEGIYEFIIQQNGVYSFNNNSYLIDGVTIDFSNTIDAIELMATQEVPVSVGFLLSVYSYWQYQPGVDFEAKTAPGWAESTSTRFKAISAPFNGKSCDIGEIGWPTNGSNDLDGAPNKPSKTVCENLYKGLLLWSQDNAPSHINLWQLVDGEPDSGVGPQHPESNYGFYNHGLKDSDNPMKFPMLARMFKNTDSDLDKKCLKRFNLSEAKR